MDRIVKIQNLLMMVHRSLSSIASTVQNGEVTISIVRIKSALRYLNELKQLLENEQRKSS